jgi:hypothetical protein
MLSVIAPNVLIRLLLSPKEVVTGSFFPYHPEFKLKLIKIKETFFLLKCFYFVRNTLGIIFPR